jgi:hypothetical protein
VNYVELPEYSSLALPADQSASPFPLNSVTPTPLQRLAARLHRHAVAPRGYRFVANIAAAQLQYAVRAIRRVSVAGELQLRTPAVDEAGQPVLDAALYIRTHLPEPVEFWTVFRSLSHRHAA